MTHKMAARADRFAPRGPRAQPPSIEAELIAVLAPHPGGLRRWSVMRAIREQRNREGHMVSLKFEIEVERVFRGACSGEVNGSPRAALFFRPEGKAGEVWAVHPHACAGQQEPVAGEA